MKIVQKLRRVNRYLRELSVGELRPVIVTSQGDAVSKLAHESGDRLLVARPEVAAEGDADCISGYVTFAFFCLAKMNGPSMTEKIEEQTFDRLEDMLEDILDRIVDDLTGGQCPVLRGLDIRSLDIVPETSIFGGWSGYSVEISLW